MSFLLECSPENQTALFQNGRGVPGFHELPDGADAQQRVPNMTTIEYFRSFRVGRRGRLILLVGLAPAGTRLQPGERETNTNAVNNVENGASGRADGPSSAPVNAEH